MTHFTAPDGARLGYEDDGAGGLPLLCLPGLTRTMRDFDDVAPHLAGVRMIRMDYRGRGTSAWTGPESYTVAREAADALALLDHLGVARTAILGTSRGGLIGMLLAATARDRIAGLILNDVGPVLEPEGLARIAAHVGRPPREETHEALAKALAAGPGFARVPPARWLALARRQAVAVPEGLRLNYDPALRAAFEAAVDAPPADLWPLFEATRGLPLALIRGANSDLLSRATVARMRAVRPDMTVAEVRGRGHVPFLDEPESLAALHAIMDALRNRATGPA